MLIAPEAIQRNQTAEHRYIDGCVRPTVSIGKESMFARLIRYFRRKQEGEVEIRNAAGQVVAIHLDSSLTDRAQNLIDAEMAELEREAAEKAHRRQRGPELSWLD